MDVGALLTESFSRIPEGVDAVLEGLDADALVARPDPDANSIAWLVWHLTRVEDAQVAEVAGTGEAWIEEGWARRFDLPLDDSDTGYAHTSEQVGSVRASAADLRGYLAAVHARSDRFLAGLVAADLDRIVDERWDPPVTLGVRLVSVVDDEAQHIGQAAYVRGLLDRA